MTASMRRSTHGIRVKRLPRGSSSSGSSEPRGLVRGHFQSVESADLLEVPGMSTGSLNVPGPDGGPVATREVRLVALLRDAGRSPRSRGAVGARRSRRLLSLRDTACRSAERRKGGVGMPDLKQVHIGYVICRYKRTQPRGRLCLSAAECVSSRVLSYPAVRPLAPPFKE